MDRQLRRPLLFKSCRGRHGFFNRAAARADEYMRNHMVCGYESRPGPRHGDVAALADRRSQVLNRFPENFHGQRSPTGTPISEINLGDGYFRIVGPPA